MPGLRVAIFSLAVAVAAAACGASGPASSQPSAATNSQAVATPTASPIASVAAIPSALAAVPTIGLYEYKVIIPSTMTAGKATFTISNFGTIPHELLIFKSALAPGAYPTNAAGDIEEDGANVTLVSDGENIEPSGSQVRAVDLTAGTYVFVCNIPGHFKQGMFTVVTVAP